VIGGVVGALGGWWAGRAVAEAATTITSDDDDYFRRHYESAPDRMADRSYEHAQPAYYLGHLASRNPDYGDRSWDNIEPDLRRAWRSDARFGSWDSMTDFAREGYHRGRSTLGNLGARAATAIDDTRDRIDGDPATRPGPDAKDSRI
jgi:hypothetical protein